MLYEKGCKIVIKTIQKLLNQGWEPIVWGWIKDRSHTFINNCEINYYKGIEEILGEDRVLTVISDHGGREGILCVETNYHIASEVVEGRYDRQG